MLVDSHCHLDRIDLSPYQGRLEGAIAAAAARGVDRLLCIGIDLNNAPTVIDIAEKFPQIYASVGVHPLDIGEGESDITALAKYAAHSKVIAIGETGLDYYYSEENKVLQQASFTRHLQLAATLRKPAIVHTRSAQDDTLALLREHSDPTVAGVLHCFTESWAMARAALELNFYISFSGIISFKNAGDLRDVVRQMPLDRLLVETDSPYLAPVPYRGKKNEPKYVREVAQWVADIKGTTLEHISEITSNNFDNLFLNKKI